MAFFLHKLLLLPRRNHSNYDYANDHQNGKPFLVRMRNLLRFYETKGETIARSVHCLVCRPHHDNEHSRAFMATNELSSL